MIPIPPDQVAVTAPHWLPFVETIAKRQRCFLDQRLADIASGQVYLVLVWDEQEKMAKALVGLSEMQRGSDRIARIVWLAGEDHDQWMGLLPELEQWCQDHGSKGMETIVRPGLQRELVKNFGYRLTHVQLEKDF